MKLRYGRGALADLEEIFAYIAQDKRMPSPAKRDRVILAQLHRPPSRITGQLIEARRPSGRGSGGL